MLAAQGKQLEELQASNTQASAPNDAHPRARPPVHGRPHSPVLSFRARSPRRAILSQILEQLAKLKGILVDLAPAAAPAAK